MASLAQNKDRKFVIMEQAFFSRWWNEQSDATQALVRQFVDNGQLAVWNGGWVQHDEAAAHYVAMIDQTTRGHRYGIVRFMCHFCLCLLYMLDTCMHTRTRPYHTHIHTT